MEIRVAPGAESGIKTFGSLGSGLATMRFAWTELRHVFTEVRSDAKRLVSLSDGVIPIQGPRYPTSLLADYPVDILAVDVEPSGPLKTDGPSRLEQLISHATSKPLVVVESWPTSAAFWRKGPTCKAARTRWAELGYVSRFHTVSAEQIGGAITQRKLLVAHVRLDCGDGWDWPSHELLPELVRPMSNLLTPPGLVPYSAYRTLPQGCLPKDPMTEAMPCAPGS
jgi:hypothetical protein